MMKGIYSRTVSRLLSVTFKGYEYDVRAVAGASAGATLRVCFFADEWPRAIRVFQAGMNGDVRLTRCLRVERDAGGFRADAVTIGASARAKGKAELFYASIKEGSQP